MPKDRTKIYKILIVIWAISWIFLSCKTSKLPHEHDTVFIEYFGGYPDDDIADDEAFKKAIDYSMKHHKKLKFGNGTYLFSKRILISDIDTDIHIVGSEKTVIQVPEHGFLRLQSASKERSLTANIERGDTSFMIGNTEGIKPQQIIRIYSDSAWETGWNYKENDTHIIKKIAGNVIYTYDPIIFNYDIIQEKTNVIISSYATVYFKNLTFEINSKTSWQRTTAIEIISMESHIENVNILAAKEDIFHRGFSLVNCPQVNINKISMRGLEYGFLMNYCRDIKVNDIEAHKVRHAMAPANACINMYAKNIIGYSCQGVIDAHQCFNVHYDSIQDIRATQFSNCRALGSKITNSTFSVIPSFYQDYKYWSNQLLSKEYEHMYSEYDTEFYNVEWIHSQPSNFNGLTTFSCRNFIIDRCTTHNISLYGRLLGKATISNSKVGTIRINSHHVDIINTTLDGSLFPNAPYIFRFSGAGQTNIEKVTAVNYDPQKTDLFEYFYNTSHNNSVKISHSHFCQLNHWTEKWIYPNLEYTTFQIHNSTFDGFLKKIPSKIFNEKNIKNNMTNISGLKFNSAHID